MARNSATRLERDDEVSDRQLEALENKKANLKDVVEVDNVRSMIFKKLGNAEKEGVLNAKDAERFRTELVENEGDSEAVRRITFSIRETITKSETELKTVKTMVASLDSDNMEKEMSIFKGMTLAERPTYLANLRKRIENLQALEKALTGMSSSEKAKFRNMSPAEREKFASELNERTQNVKKYSAILNSKDYKDALSEESQKEWLRDFNELKTLEEQRLWLDKDQLKQQLKPRKERADQYKSFPDDVRNKFPDFLKKRSPEKIIMLQQMERLMIEKCKEVLNGPLSKNFSEKSRKFALDSFKSADNKMRVKMLELLPKFMKEEGKYGDQFEKMDASIKLSLQDRFGFKDFHELDFEMKMKVAIEGIKMNTETEKIKSLYLPKLQNAVQEKIMSQKSMDDFLLQFESKPLETKRDWLIDFEEKEYLPRKAITKKFTHLPKDFQKKHEAEFYESGFTRRNEIVNEYYQASGQIESTTTTDGNTNETEVAKKTSELEQGRQHGQLKNNPKAANGNAEFDSEALDWAIDQTVGGSSAQQEIADMAIASKMVEFVEKRDLYNKTTKQSQAKNHLKTQKERDISDQFQEFTDGKMVLAANDNGGKIMAKEVTEFDMNKFNNNKDTRRHMLEFTRAHLTEAKSKNVTDVQLMDKETGYEQSGEIAAEKLEDKQDQQKLRLARKVAEKIPGIDPHKLSPAQLHQIIARMEARNSFEVDLREAT